MVTRPPLIAVLLALLTTSSAARHQDKVDLLIYGATPAGIAAARRAAQCGHKVLLIEPTSRIGGMVTNGLSHSDFRTFEGYSGTFREFTQRVERYYKKRYGPRSTQASKSRRGTHGEPHVNLLIFQQMLAEHPSITVVTGRRLHSAEVDNEGRGRRITSVRLRDESDGTYEIRAQVYIDASYEGDLMAKARVPFTVGREGRRQYDELLAPTEPDGQVQGYNLRLTMTQRPESRVLPKAPRGYDRDDFVALLPLLEARTIKRVFFYPPGGIYKPQVPELPNGKYDVNDVSRGLVRLSLPQINNAWPNGDHATRNRILAEHVRHNIGMLYFLQNDPKVPRRFRDEARQWGLCKDEFQENDHVPMQLYVREARRMIGRYVFTEHDTNHATGDARGVFQPNAIAMGDYGPNCHGTDHVGPRIGGRHTGEFYKRVPPYQIPYGIIIPRRTTNLFVPVAASASHVGFCALRLEPIWCALGDAAGFAAHRMLDASVTVQQVSPTKVRQLLHANGCATIYVSDVRESDQDFVAVQWWGGLGGLHGLNPAPDRPGRRGKHLYSQYYEAYPGHDADLDYPLGRGSRERWSKLARAAGVRIDAPKHAITRRAFIRWAFEALHATD